MNTGIQLQREETGNSPLFWQASYILQLQVLETYNEIY